MPISESPLQSGYVCVYTCVHTALHQAWALSGPHSQRSPRLTGPAGPRCCPLQQHPPHAAQPGPPWLSGPCGAVAAQGSTGRKAQPAPSGDGLPCAVCRLGLQGLLPGAGLDCPSPPGPREPPGWVIMNKAAVDVHAQISAQRCIPVSLLHALGMQSLGRRKPVVLVLKRSAPGFRAAGPLSLPHSHG